MSLPSIAPKSAALAALLAIVPLPAGASESTKDASADLALSVTLSGARNDKGQLAVALYATDADFPRPGRALRASKLAIARGSAVVTFRGLKPGAYAIAVLHDENSNSKMDFNFLGMPLEGYGFSNDAPVSFGPPSFEAAAFKLVAPHSRVPIRVRYF